MVYKIQLSTEDNVGEMAQLALQERLYENEEWEMRECLQDVISGHPKSISPVVAIITEGDVPVGACLYASKSYATVQTYVKPSHRRKGYGTALITKVVGNIPEGGKVSVGVGIPESSQFFRRLIGDGVIPFGARWGW